MHDKLRTIYRIDGDTRTRIRLHELAVGDLFEVWDSDKLVSTGYVVEPPTKYNGVWGVTMKEKEN